MLGDRTARHHLWFLLGYKLHCYLRQLLEHMLADFCIVPIAVKEIIVDAIVNASTTATVVNGFLVFISL